MTWHLPCYSFEFFTFPSSLPQQEDDDFERHIEENDFGIGILRNHAFAVFEEVGDVNDVCLVDEAGKVLGKVLLFCVM